MKKRREKARYPHLAILFTIFLQNSYFSLQRKGCRGDTLSKQRSCFGAAALTIFLAAFACAMRHPMFDSSRDSFYRAAFRFYLWVCIAFIMFHDDDEASFVRESSSRRLLCLLLPLDSHP
jgi:hypothetical protein